jgi:hypothetical protein
MLISVIYKRNIKYVTQLNFWIETLLSFCLIWRFYNKIYNTYFLLTLKIFFNISCFRVESLRKCEWIIFRHIQSLFFNCYHIFKSLKQHEKANIFICATHKTMCSYRIESCLNFKSDTKYGNHVMDMTQKNIIILSVSIKTFSSEFTHPRRDNIKTFWCVGSIGIVSASPRHPSTNVETSEAVWAGHRLTS